MPKSRLTRLKQAKRKAGRNRAKNRRPEKKLDLRAIMNAEIAKLENAKITDRLSAISRVGIVCSGKLIDSFRFVPEDSRKRKLAKDIAAYRIKSLILLSRGLTKPVFVGTFEKFLHETVELLDNYEKAMGKKPKGEEAVLISLTRADAVHLINSYKSFIPRKTLLTMGDIIIITNVAE
ncbi:MAG: hypothetical protein QGI60_01955, partial [archaeon]|nr:hypothetical protein [archaeon]